MTRRAEVLPVLPADHETRFNVIVKPANPQPGPANFPLPNLSAGEKLTTETGRKNGNFQASPLSPANHACSRQLPISLCRPNSETGQVPAFFALTGATTFVPGVFRILPRHADLESGFSRFQRKTCRKRDRIPVGFLTPC